ncbi:MAG: 2-dehydropantoate 2-reductase [Bacillaceae bacterium]|nr:2-dehydropantoate 2-reductase [Bacillaceae bacterium]
MRKIGIIGAGAVGMLFAHYLSTNFNVTLYVRRQEQAELLKKGLYVSIAENVFINKSIQIKIFGEVPLEEKVQIVTVKQYSLNPVIETLQRSNHVHTVIFIQNGMSHIEEVSKLEKQTWLGVVEHGIRKESDNSIIHTGIGKTKLSPLSLQSQSNDPFIEEWKESLRNTFEVEINENWKEILTIKLLVNAVINPLTALFQVKNGDLLENKHYEKSMRLLFEEVYSIIPVSNKEDVWKHIVQICINTSANYSSMYRDVEKLQQTEVDAILGYVIKKSQEQNKNAPLTQFLLESIKGKTE